MDDIYKTIAGPAEAVIRERSSKFYSYAYPITDADEVKALVDGLKKQYYDATHHCYAYRLGPAGETFRVNDDGEPSGTAGRPILGQMMSAGITDCLVVVVRYFGGTKLGVPGLISAYKESAAAAIEAAEIVEKTVDTIFRVGFPYITMNEIMKVIKEEQPRIIDQNFDNQCSMTLAVRRSRADIFFSKLNNIDSISIDAEGYNE